MGSILVDTNGDGTADAGDAGKIVGAGIHPSAAQNTAAANFAARIAYGSTGLTLPIVVTASEDQGVAKRAKNKDCQGWREGNLDELIQPMATGLKKGQGGIFAFRAAGSFGDRRGRYRYGILRLMRILRARRISGECREINFRRLQMQ